jgi:hypothetical protein
MVSRNTMHKSGSALTFVAGIGPEISQSIKDIYTAAGVRDNELNLFIYPFTLRSGAYPMGGS